MTLSVRRAFRLLVLKQSKIEKHYMQYHGGIYMELQLLNFTVWQ